MNHVDLFSGIGGFALAAKWTGFETVVFCEKDEFCQKVLQKRFGGFIADSKSMGWRNGATKDKGTSATQINASSNSACIPIIPEIRDFDGTKWRGATLLTGGFPCQPFSVAGKRKGKEDDRYLWPEMLRVIKEAKPRWILAENVAGILKMALDTVLADLESEGYTTRAVVIPAAGVNAPHRRDRIWIIAHTIGSGAGCDNRTIDNKKGRTSKGGREGIRQKNGKIGTGGVTAANQDAPDSADKWRGAIQKPEQSEGNTGRETAGNADGDAPDSKSERYRGSADKECSIQGRDIFQGKQKGHKVGNQTKRCLDHTPDSDRVNGNDARFSTGEIPFIEKAEIQGCDSWEIPWLEVATSFCRVDDGVPNRVDRLKSLGNAIVPQVAAEIMRGIARCVT